MTATQSAFSPLPLDVQAAPDPMTAIRIALRATLLSSGPLVARLGGQHVYRRLRETDEPHFPSITFYDFGTPQYTGQGPTPPVLLEIVWTLDIWATTADEAEAIAHLVRRLLHQQPMPVAGNVARVEYMGWVGSRDDAAEDGDVARKTLTFRMLAYLRI